MWGTNRVQEDLKCLILMPWPLPNCCVGLSYSKQLKPSSDRPKACPTRGGRTGGLAGTSAPITATGLITHTPSDSDCQKWSISTITIPALIRVQASRGPKHMMRPIHLKPSNDRPQLSSTREGNAAQVHGTVGYSRALMCHWTDHTF